MKAGETSFEIRMILEKENKKQVREHNPPLVSSLRYEIVTRFLTLRDSSTIRNKVVVVLLLHYYLTNYILSRDAYQPVLHIISMQSYWRKTLENMMNKKKKKYETEKKYKILKDHSIQELRQSWSWTLRYSKKYYKGILLYTLFGVLGSTMGLAASVAAKYLIDLIIDCNFTQLVFYGILMIMGSVSSLVFSSIAKYLQVKTSILVNNEIQEDVFRNIMDTQWLSLKQYANGDLLNRFSNDIHTVSANAVTWLPNAFIHTYTFLITLAIICYYDVIMALIALISVPFLLGSSHFLIKKMKQYKQKMLDYKSDLISFESESFYNIDIIKSFGVMDIYQEKLSAKQNGYAKSSLEYNLFSIQFHAWMSVFAILIALISFGYCLSRLWSGAITFGTMSLFLQQRSKLSSRFKSLVKMVPGIIDSAVCAQRILEIVKLPKEYYISESSFDMKKVEEKGLTIQMKHVDFSYEDGQCVISDSDFLACPNEIVALIGTSGEGKTTILRMILGLIQPNQGESVVVDADGMKFPTNSDIRRFISYVPQGNTLFAGTVAENLRMAKRQATDDELENALKISCAWEFVEKMEGGLYHQLGEQGKGLSEGQAQRIAIARAILRDAPILLFDEATSALDTETEHRVVKNIMIQKPNKTCIVSTHRTSVLDMCQRVYHITDTKIIEKVF